MGTIPHALEGYNFFGDLVALLESIISDKIFSSGLRVLSLGWKWAGFHMLQRNETFLCSLLSHLH